jgi:hypothetical protein
VKLKKRLNRKSKKRLKEKRGVFILMRERRIE